MPALRSIGRHWAVGLGAFGASAIVSCSSASPKESGADAPDGSSTRTSVLDEADAGVADGSDATSCSAPLGGRVHVPADDAAHLSEPMEWWYWTGHLKTSDGRWFGFEEVFFRVKVLGAPGHMVHSAITDIDRNAFHHFARVGVGDLASQANGFDFSSVGHRVKGGNGHDALVANGNGYSLDLALSTTRRPVLQHGSGYTDYSFGGYTYYYSRERMEAAGTITLDGEVLPVTGTAWFDHQYGDIVSAVNNGWDWFAFQLDDHREMMLFVVRVHGKQVLVGASVTDDGCTTTEVQPSDVAVTALGSWKSPHTMCTYPAGWKVRVKDETFVVTPFVADQEIPTSTPIYWEGASKVAREDGTSVGRAYVELSGYCPPLP